MIHEAVQCTVMLFSSEVFVAMLLDCVPVGEPGANSPERTRLNPLSSRCGAFARLWFANSYNIFGASIVPNCEVVAQACWRGAEEHGNASLELGVE